MSDKPKNEFQFTSDNVKRMVEEHNAKNPYLDDYDREQVNPTAMMEDYFFAKKEPSHSSKTHKDDDFSYVFEGISPTEISAQILKSIIGSANPNYYLAGTDIFVMLRGLHTAITDLMQKDKTHR